MNLLQFLKSTRGAIKPLNALLISGAAGAVFAYTVSTVDDQIQAQRQVRTLSGIAATSPQQGMLRRDGQLTSINIGDRGNHLATPEERAAFQGNRAVDRYLANQQALSGMDAALDRAAQFSETDGLNTGNRDIVQQTPQLVQGTSVDTGEGVAGAVTRAGAKPAGQGASTGGSAAFAPAAITRASGSNPGASSGAVSGGIVSGPGNTRSGEGMRLSGAMPGGSNIMSQRGLDKGPLGSAGTSAFRNGRDGYITRGPKNGQGKNELEDIAKRSARAAASATPSANEGAQAFLAGGTRSGGVQVEGVTDGESTSSEDLAAPSSSKLRSIGNHLNTVENEQEKRNEAHRALINRLLVTLAISLGMMAAGMAILPRLHGIWKVIVAAAMVGVVFAANAALFTAARHFIRDYGKAGGTGMAWFTVILAPLLVAGMTYVAIDPKGAWSNLKKLGSNIWKSIKKGFNMVDIAMGSLKNTVVNSIFR